MKISACIQQAIRQAASDLGCRAELARRCGIDNSTLGKYLKHRIRRISSENWEKLYPHIAKYLPRNHKLHPPSLLGLNAPASLDGDDLKLRRMLFYAYSDGKLYHDDGELQDNRYMPFIDFRRDPVDLIDSKMHERVVRSFVQASVERARCPECGEHLGIRGSQTTQDDPSDPEVFCLAGQHWSGRLSECVKPKYK